MDKVLDLKNPEPQQEPEPIPSGDVLGSLFSAPEPISWEASHQPSERERSREYVFLGAVAAVGGVVAWWQSSWLTIGVIAAGVIAWELHNRFPTTHRIELTDRGLSVDGHQHRYEHLHSYDIHEMSDGTRHVSIQTARWHLPHMRIPLGQQDASEVDALLSRYLAKEEHKIPLLDWFMKK
jgi:hypothetical protein